MRRNKLMMVSSGIIFIWIFVCIRIIVTADAGKAEDASAVREMVVTRASQSDIEAIGQLSGLRKLELDIGKGEFDLTPLTNLQNLEEETSQSREDMELTYFPYSCRKTAGGYEIRLYDKESRESFLFISSYRPKITEVADNIWNIRISRTDSFECDFYFSRETMEMSDGFCNSILVGNKYVAYMEEDEKLVLAEMFEYGRSYRERAEIIRNFSGCIPAVKSITLMEGDNILLEYFSGEENETITEELCISDYEWDLERWRKDVEDGGEEGYRRYICKEVADGFEVKLYGREGEEIYSFVYPKEPTINKITDDVIQISFSTGTESVYLLYFDRKNGKVSDVYYNAIPIGDKYIAYMEDHENLKIESMFDQQFFAEIKRDFSKAAAPGYQIESIGAIDEETIFLRYLRGGEYERTIEIICLLDYMKEKEE